MPSLHVFRRQPHRASILLSALALVSVLLLPSCSGNGAASSDAPAAGRGGGGRGGRGADAGGGVPVSTARAVERAVPIEVTTVGTVEAYSSLEVRPQITGQLTSVDFAEGDEVRQGQPLFTIDPRPFEATLKQAEAARDRDAAQAANADAVRIRNASLLKDGILAQSEYDASVTTATALKAVVASDNAVVDNARLQLQYTKIVAPVAGRTGALIVHPGSLVRSGDAQPLVVINQIVPIRVTFAVPGQFLVAIRRGQERGPLPVTARVSSDTGAPSTGVLSFIDNTVDQGTATIKLKATLPNKDHRLWPGDLTQTTLRLGVDQRAIVVPVEAVQNGQQGQYVYVVGEDQTVSMRPVRVARTNGGDAVIAEGVKAGDEVVTDGQLRLTPGVRVSIKPPIGGGGTR
jgi:multidrug efflux system membrane fusion protein